MLFYQTNVRLYPLFSFSLISIYINSPWFVLKGFPGLYLFNQFVGNEVLKGKTLCSISDEIIGIIFRKLRIFAVCGNFLQCGFLFADITGTK